VNKRLAQKRRQAFDLATRTSRRITKIRPPMQTSFYHPSRRQPYARADWIGLVFMSLMAPLIGAGIQSIWVFQSDHWIYQAAIGGAYFHAVEQPGVSTTRFIFCSCGGLAIPTYLILLALPQRALYRWLAWMVAIAVWTWFYFASEITIK